LPIFRGDEDRRSYLEFMSGKTERFRVGILAWRAKKTGRPWVDHEHLPRIEKETGRNLQKEGEPRTGTARFHEISDVSPDSYVRGTIRPNSGE